MRIIHQGPRASSPDSQAEYTQAIRPRFCLLLENALQFGGSPYTRLGAAISTAAATALVFEGTGVKLEDKAPTQAVVDPKLSIGLEGRGETRAAPVNRGNSYLEFLEIRLCIEV